MLSSMAGADTWSSIEGLYIILTIVISELGGGGGGGGGLSTALIDFQMFR